MPEDEIEILKIAMLSEHKEEALLIVEIISAWNIIEDSLAGLLSIWSDIDPDQAHVFMAFVAGGKSRLDAVKAAGEFFLKRRNPELIAELNDTFKILGQRYKCRNKYAHGRYQESEDGKLFLVNRAFETLHPQAYEILYINGLKNEIDQVLRLLFSPTAVPLLSWLSVAV
jgi:hypothetical protein